MVQGLNSLKETSWEYAGFFSPPIALRIPPPNPPGPPKFSLSFIAFAFPRKTFLLFFTDEGAGRS